ncbi:MAG: dTDP-4-dehydrorhamnose reductase [Desulfobacca sp.]|uniref:dTDP-4-dehydrorhamnose reductase n=1 Tax=Desulfobacca sp. TaxID=2067990 RepID=UPI00404AC13E
MKIVLIGKNGQLGSDCAEVLRPDHELVALGSRELDITQAPQVEAMVQRERPDLVLNCAAYTKVDAAEQERALAYAINVTGPRYLAVSLARQGGRLLHISTDYVFDGRKPVPTPYHEDDPPAPLSYYGQTKAAAEEAIRQEMDDYLIVRTAWMYGCRGHNFLKTMLRLALQETPVQIRVVNDQFGSPTWSYRLAQQLAALIAAGGQGIYHATGEGYTTWYGLATTFFQVMGVDVPVTPITTAEYPTPARRPANSILENQRLKDQGLNLMRPWQDDLEEFVSRYREALYQEIRGA